MTDDEIWKPVLGWDGYYEVCQAGVVRSVMRRGKNGKWYGGQIVSPVEKTNGYMAVNMTRPGTREQRSLHRIVLEAFRGPCPAGSQGCHGDGDRKNNALGNLRWDTVSANHADKRAHGTMLRGETHPNAKLTADLVRRIRQIGDSKEAARQIGVPERAAHHVLAGETWGHLR